MARPWNGEFKPLSQVHTQSGLARNHRTSGKSPPESTRSARLSHLHSSNTDSFKRCTRSQLYYSAKDDTWKTRFLNPVSCRVRFTLPILGKGTSNRIVSTLHNVPPIGLSIHATTYCRTRQSRSRETGAPLRSTVGRLWT